MGVRQFTDVLRDLRFGEALEELSKEFNGAVLAVEDTGKPATITLTVTVKPSTAGALEVFDDIKVKLPKASKSSSLFFATPEGNLVRNDPRQETLPGLKLAGEEVRQPLKEATNG